MSNELMNELEIILQNKVPERHSYFQIKNFIVNSEPTIQGQIRQVLRELKTRRDSINVILNDLEESNENIELLEIKIKRLEQSKIQDELDKKENEIKIRSLKRKEKKLISNIGKIKENLKYIQEETEYFLLIFKKLVEVEPIKDFDDEEVQKEYWETKLTKEMEINLSLGCLPMELIKTILQLNNDSVIKQNLLGLLNHRKEILISSKGKND